MLSIVDFSMDLRTDRHTVVGMIDTTLSKHFNMVDLKVWGAVWPEEWCWFVAILTATVGPR